MNIQTSTAFLNKDVIFLSFSIPAHQLNKIKIDSEIGLVNPEITTSIIERKRNGTRNMINEMNQRTRVKITPREGGMNVARPEIGTHPPNINADHTSQK